MTDKEIKTIQIDAVEKAQDAVIAWFKENFDDSFLKKMEEAKLIANGEGFFHGCIAELMVGMEISVLGDVIEDDSF